MSLTASRLLHRAYSQRATPPPSSSRLKHYAMTSYLVGAMTLPFVPPYLASKRSEKDGSWMTRPPLKFTYRPLL